MGLLFMFEEETVALLSSFWLLVICIVDWNHLVTWVMWRKGWLFG